MPAGWLGWAGWLRGRPGTPDLTRSLIEHILRTDKLKLNYPSAFCPGLLLLL